VKCKTVKAGVISPPYHKKLVNENVV